MDNQDQPQLALQQPTQTTEEEHPLEDVPEQQAQQSSQPSKIDTDPELFLESEKREKPIKGAADQLEGEPSAPHQTNVAASSANNPPVLQLHTIPDCNEAGISPTKTEQDSGVQTYRSNKQESDQSSVELCESPQAQSPIPPASPEKQNHSQIDSPTKLSPQPDVLVRVEAVKLQPIQPKPSPTKSDQSTGSKLVFVKNNLPEKPKNTGYFQARVLSIGKKEDDPFSVQNLLKQEQPNIMNIELLPGEQIMINEDASLLTEKSKTDGKIVFTNYQLSFVSRELRRINIPLGYIGKLERTVETRPVVYSTIDVTMKMGTQLKFKFTSAKEISINIFKVMGKFIYCEVGEVFAFSHWKAKKYTNITTDPRELAVMNGWDSYNWRKEYKRMGVPLEEGSPFRVVGNADGRVCVTYPEYFIVPARLSDETMRKSMKSRSRDRLPALSYAIHLTKENRFVCLWRSSQMKFNVNVTRNLADEEYVRCLGNLTNEKSPKNKDIAIFELKQRTSAVSLIVSNSNRACSFAPENYKNAEVAVLEYEGLAAVRQSYNRMIAASTLNEPTKWLALVEQSRWYENLAGLLKDATIVAEYLQNNENVLVQCSEGTDRTPQICSLVQIMLDPYYRTLEGFAVLVEKEWVDFGHPFGLRLGIRKDKETDERAPVFLQFLDGVSQLIRQYPLSFEFTCHYLAKVGFELYSNRYGNFLCSGHSEQLEHKIFQETLSIWGELLQENNELYVNPFFVLAQESDMFELRRPNFSPKSCVFFREHFLRLTSEVRDDYRRCELAEQNHDYPNLLHGQLRTQIDSLKRTVQTDQQEIARLRAQLHELAEES